MGGKAEAKQLTVGTHAINCTNDRMCDAVVVRAFISLMQSQQRQVRRQRCTCCIALTYAKLCLSICSRSAVVPTTIIVMSTSSTVQQVLTHSCVCSDSCRSYAYKHDEVSSDVDIVSNVTSSSWCYMSIVIVANQQYIAVTPLNLALCMNVRCYGSQYCCCWPRLPHNPVKQLQY
jgi:hypothetical protein